MQEYPGCKSTQGARGAHPMNLINADDMPHRYLHAIHRVTLVTDHTCSGSVQEDAAVISWRRIFKKESNIYAS